MKTAEGTFNISMQPQEDADFAVGRLTIDKEYSGALVATGKGQMLSHRSSTQGSAGYVAIEYVSGSLDGKEGSFVLQHSGQMLYPGVWGQRRINAQGESQFSRAVHLPAQHHTVWRKAGGPIFAGANSR